MKKIILIFLLESVFLQFSHAQRGENLSGGYFLKRVEYNLSPFENVYNFQSKGDWEKLFLGDFNAPVEFFYEPPFDGSVALRLVKDLTNTFNILEIKYITNYREARSVASNKYPMIGLSSPFAVSKERGEEIRDHNREMIKKSHEESLKLFIIESKKIPVSEQFAVLLYRSMVSFIDNFKAKRDFPYKDGVLAPNSGDSLRHVIIVNGGDRVNFRTVVDDEVWSLQIHIPTGNALKMSDLCNQIISDVQANTFNEQKHLSVLNTFH